MASSQGEDVLAEAGNEVLSSMWSDSESSENEVNKKLATENYDLKMEVRRLKTLLAASEAMTKAREEQVEKMQPENSDLKLKSIEMRARKAERAEAEQRLRAEQRLFQIKALDHQVKTLAKRAHTAESKIMIQSAQEKEEKDKDLPPLEGILTLTEELLEYAGLDATQEALRAERACSRGPLSSMLAANRPEALEKLIEAMQTGKYQDFIRAWALAVPFLALRKDRTLRELRLECAGLLALEPLRNRINPTAPYPNTPAEREALEIFKTVLAERPLEDDDTCKFLALPQLHAPWTRFQAELDDWQAHAADAAIRLKERIQFSVNGVCWLNPPRLLLLYDNYNKWHSELCATCLRQQTRSQDLQKASAELYVLLAWMIHDQEEQRKNGQEEPFFFRQLRSRLAALKPVVLNEYSNVDDAAIIHMPPPLDATKLRQVILSARGAGADERVASVLAALAARLNSNSNLLRVSTAQLLISTDALGLSDSFGLETLDPRKATPASTAHLLLTAARSPRNFSDPEIVRRLYAALICRLAGREDGRNYLLTAVQRAPLKIGPLPENNKLWPSPDLITVFLHEVASITNLAWPNDMDSTTAYAALTLQRLSLEPTVARKLIYLGAVPILLAAAQALLDDLYNEKTNKMNERSPLIGVFVAGTLLNVCANDDAAVLFSNFEHEAASTPTSKEILSEHDRKYVLPLGWVAGANPVYFYNYATGESTWEAPADKSPQLCLEISRLLLRVRKNVHKLNLSFKPTVHAASKHLLGALLCLGAHAARKVKKIQEASTVTASIDDQHFVQCFTNELIHDLEQLEVTENEASRSKSPVRRTDSDSRPRSGSPAKKRAASLSPNKAKSILTSPAKKRSSSLSPAKFKQKLGRISFSSQRPKSANDMDALTKRPKSAKKERSKSISAKQRKRSSMISFAGDARHRKASRRPTEYFSGRRKSRWEKLDRLTLTLETRHVLDCFKKELGIKKRRKSSVNTTSVTPGSSVRAKTIVIEELWPGADSFKKANTFSMKRFFPRDEGEVSENDKQSAQEDTNPVNLEAFLEPFYIQKHLSAGTS